MSDLISRSELIEFAIKHFGGEIDCNDIAIFPAVDAVPVVRCRACKEWKHGLCKLLCADTPDDGYCSFGAKMDGGAEA